MPITALIFRSYFASVPRDLLDAGRIDGAGFFGLYYWIMLPMAAPAFAVALIWQFTQIWNDFLLGVVVLSSPARAPMTVAINNIAGSFSVEWNLQMAAATAGRGAHRPRLPVPRAAVHAGPAGRRIKGLGRSAKRATLGVKWLGTPRPRRRSKR